MNFGELVVLIGLAIIVYVLLRAKHFSAMSIGANDGDNGTTRSGREAELEREVTELRERVKVLERITVDGRETHLLSDEIEKLRDK
jgi:hypothetical protein